MEKWKKLVIGLLAAVLLLSVMPFSAVAAEGMDMPAPEEGVQELDGAFPEPGADDPGADMPDDGAPVGPNPDEGPGEAPEEPGEGLEESDPIEPAPEGRPQLETEAHRVYIRGSGDQVNPDQALTRAEAAQVVYSLLREPPEKVPGSRFPDVAEGQWYAGVVNAMTDTGLLYGYDNGNFGPMDHISRAEFVAILARCVEPEEAVLDFPDVSPDHWAYKQLATAVAKGWLFGKDGGTLQPDADVTRAEAVSICNRAMGRGKGSRDALTREGDVLQFLDLPPTHWAYYDIMEASLPHAPEITEAGERWLSYQVPAAQRAPGYYNLDGELYCVDSSGHYVHSASIGLLQFDSRGRYTSGNVLLDQRLTAIVQREGVEGDSQYNNLRRMYQYVMNRCSYRANSFVAEGSAGWEPQRALDMLGRQGRGNCYDYAALFTMLARKLGYQARGQSGWIRTADWDWDEHGWTEITLNGRAYFCDPEFQGVYVRSHGLDWDLFMKQYGSTPTGYQVLGQILR